jgi:hypothetical protein
MAIWYLLKLTLGQTHAVENKQIVMRKFQTTYLILYVEIDTDERNLIKSMTCPMNKSRMKQTSVVLI